MPYQAHALSINILDENMEYLINIWLSATTSLPEKVSDPMAFTQAQWYWQAYGYGY